MHVRTVYLIKPDGSVGYEFYVGDLPESEIDAEARRAALDEGVGESEEIRSWSLMIGPPE
jgi:hypothetical protein